MNIAGQCSKGDAAGGNPDDALAALDNNPEPNGRSIPNPRRREFR
jgi:hypothetical protein